CGAVIAPRESRSRQKTPPASPAAGRRTRAGQHLSRRQPQHRDVQAVTGHSERMTTTPDGGGDKGLGLGPVPEMSPAAEAGDGLSPAPRVQILAREHWSLLATRSMTWSEIMSRITIQLTVLTASLVVLALAAQSSGFDTPIKVLSIGLAAA